MKIAKKSLSVFLSLLMMFGACSVALTGLSVTSYAATGTLQSVKNALTDEVVNEIVYNGDLKDNSYTYKGDADVVAAADEIYAYAMSLRGGTGVTAQVNSTAGFLAKVAANTGFTSGDKYTALQYILDPPGSVITAIESAAAKNKQGECDGCDHKAAYPTIPTDTAGTPQTQKVVKLYTSVSSLISKYGSLDSIPASLLQGVEYKYSMWTDQAVQDENEHKSGCDTVYDCCAYRWNYFRNITRSEIKNVVSIKELKDYSATLAAADLSMTFDEMVALSAAELDEIYNENYGPYQEMIDKYTFETVKKLFGSYNRYFDDLLKAKQINLAMPALDIIIANYGKSYDNTNYDEMAAIYAPMKGAYDVIKNFGSDVFDYVQAKDEYKDLDLAAVLTYIDDLSYALDVIKLTELKPIIDADLAENATAGDNPKDTANPPSDILYGLIEKFEGYKATIENSNFGAVNTVLRGTDANVDTFLEKLYEKRSNRTETESAFNGQMSYWTPILHGNYTELLNHELISMHADYDTKLQELKDLYAELVAEHGAAVVDPLFKVTLGEGGTPTLLTTAVESMKTTALNSLKAEMVARNSTQLAVVAEYEGLAANVNFNNFIEVGNGFKGFDQSLYDYCAHADRNWVSSSDTALYAKVSTIITNYTNFVNGINTSGFTKVELDKNGVYVVRDVYENDLVKDEAYTVTTDKLNQTIVKLDNFLASEDFGALLGFEDENGDPLGLGDYLYDLIGGFLFSSDLINMVIAMLFPMIEDLLKTAIPDLLNGEDVNPNKVPPSDRNAIGYVAIGALLDGAEGGIDVYLNDETFEGQNRIQQTYVSLLKNAGLYIFPETFADSMVSSGVITTSSEVYKAFKAAGSSWHNLGVFDPETETFTYDFTYDWGVTDKATFAKAFGGILDTIKPLLPTAFLNQALDITLGTESNPAGVGYGSIKYSIVSISNKEFYATLPLSLQPLNVYSNILQPLFKALGLNANASLSSSSKGIDYANAILNPVFELLDKVAANPLDTILGLLPSLAEILATDFVDDLLSKIMIDVSVSLKIVGSNDGTFDTLAGLLGSLLTFELFGDQLGMNDLLGASQMKDIIGVDIRNINNLLDFVFEKLGVELDLPDIDQSALIACAKWNGKHNLTADKADVLYFLLDYVTKALGTDFLATLIGGDEEADPDDILTKVLGAVKASATANNGDIVAAIVELLNPVEYSLKPMTWAEGPAESVVYLNYANEWTKSESQYLIDNALDIVNSVLGLTGGEALDVNAFLAETVNGLFEENFTNATITSLVESLAGIELPEILNTILVDELGVDMAAWANDFGYLFNEEVAAPATTVLGVTAVKDAEGNIVWNGLADGDRDAFIDTLLALLAPFAPAVAWLFGGKDLGVFGVVELKGYESFDSTLGVLLRDVLGVNVPAVDFANAPMAALNTVADAVFAWLDATLAADNLAERAVNLVADLLWYVDSNGLSVLLNNLLLPVLALVDTVRPIIDVDVDTILSVVVSDLINGNGLDLDKILDMLFGEFEGNDDILVTVTLDSINLATVFTVVDKMFKTDLTNSALVNVGLKGIRNADLDAADALTIILSSLIDCLDDPAAEEGKTNAQAIFAYVAEKTGNNDIGEIVDTILDFIGGVVYEYSQPNWGYMFGTDEEFNTTLPEHSIVYLGYSNNWTKETADAVYGSLEDILKIVLDSALEGKSIATLLNGILEDNVYSDEIVNTVVELLVNLISALDETLRETVDVLVDTDIATWFSFCTYNAETEKYECTKDWNVTGKDSFVAAIKEVLAPANQLLAFLFFGDGYEFFSASTGGSLITLNGGEGYAKGLVPILEALGCTMKPASAYYANGRYDVPAAVEDIFNALLTLVDKVSDKPIEEAFKLIPNIIYFLNADGFKSSVNNLLEPVNKILDKLAPVTGGFSLAEFITDAIGLDISNITTEGLLAFASDYGFVMSDKLVNLVKTFYIGELVEFESANGDLAYRMAYTDSESASDMLTIILSLAIDLFKQNDVLFTDLLGENNYNAIMALLGLEGSKAMKDFDWLYTEDADTDKTFTALESSKKFGATYDEDWTKDKAQYMVDNADDIISDILHLLNLKINGQKVTDIESLINNLLASFYSKENAEALLTLVKDLIAQLSDLEPYGDLIKTVAKSSLGVDLTAWDTMELDVVDGDRDSFEKAIGQILAPVVPVLEILLTSKDVSFLVDIEGENAITLYGSEGYAYGIVPLLEALGCTTVLTPDAYKAAIAEDPANAITAIIDPLLDRIDKLAADPFNELLELLPGVIYFINSNGLDTAAKNLLNSVDTVLECLEPMIGKASIFELLGIDLATYNFEYLINLVVDMAADAGFEIRAVVIDAVAELTIGRVVSYQSKNGETYYTMKYASDRDKADMLTVILRLLVSLLDYDENVATVKALLKNSIDGEGTEDSFGYKSVCAMLDAIVKAAREDENKSKALAYIYSLFVTANISTDIADEAYHEVVNSWEYVLKTLETSNEPLLNDLANALKQALNDNLGTDYEINEKEESDEPLTGFALFIAKIKDFFKKIGDWFKKLFGGN